ncbi:hypothetical protein ADL22_05120 [Streptomyces sp. NRRL F-4489]|uniref:DUF1453 domain-containing protein n=1 Tax=Streptomyces sp. NRRL F-4489 TaxID=1609095 RepID=UPI00074694DF|nr:DUF1453 domain-containing protein [Streptomyces sp. NRRL F-4489]KUL52321.1 hypothetical protein ADL22_05120 [Streptomyces sp. NRRL F-4489]
MNGWLDIAVLIAVVAIVFARQFTAQRITSGGRKWWLMPAVLVFLALRQPGLLDPAHRAASVILLAVSLVIGLASGAAWAWTTRIWTDETGVVWTKGTWAAAGVWLCGTALRLGLMGIAAALGVHQGSQATLLSVGAMLLTRAGVTTWRAQGLQRTYRVPAVG